MSKYYWLLIRECRRNGTAYDSDCIADKHPFEYIAELEDTQGETYARINERILLLDWKEISKEEYELFEKLENRHNDDWQP